MPTTTRPRLELDPAVVRRARSLARAAGRPVVRLAQRHTTVSVERATLRLAGLSGADHERVPWVNHLVDAVRGQVGLEHGVTTPVWDALVVRSGEPGEAQRRPLDRGVELEAGARRRRHGIRISMTAGCPVHGRMGRKSSR